MNKIVSKKKSLIPFILGIVISQNIMYLFKVGNTYLNISYIFSFLVLLYNLIFKPSKIRELFKLIDKKMLIFLLIIIFSIVQYCITILFIAPNIKISGFWTGLVLYGFAFSVYLCVLIYKSDYKKIIKGLEIGIIINIIFCVISYIVFNHGGVFSLYSLFPQEYFYVPIRWDSRLLMPTNNYLIYTYRASGLFLESSHFIAFIACTLLIVLCNNKKINVLFKFALLILLYLMIISYSGTLVSIIFAAILFIILSLLNKKNKKIPKKLLIGIIALLFLIFIGGIVLDYTGNLANILNSAYESLMSANLSDSGNSIRLLYMKNALECIGRYPWGVGFNMSSILLDTLYGTHATFNYLFTITLELGPVGLIVYLWLFLGNISNLWKQKQNKYDIALITCLFTILLVQVFNGISFVNPYVVLIFALCQIRLIELKEDYK